MPNRLSRSRAGVRWASAGLAITLLAGCLCSTHAAELRRTPIVAAVDRAKGAIVNIHGEKSVPVDDAHAGQPENLRRVNGMGTGVVVDPRGYIITNHHVVDNVPRINVTLSDESTYVAKLISYDVATDLAIIHVDAGHPLPVIPIGTSDDLMLGETVIAVGNAYGYSHTVTQGIISALHRSVQVSDMQGYDDLIQTDAAINPGNSGGPLLNIDGDMIGVNVAVRAGAQLIGFAIPVDSVLVIAADLLSSRRIGQTWHGITGKPQDGGLLVTEIDEDSPAASTGLKVGDVITAVDDQQVARAVDLERAMLGHQAGEDVKLSVQHEKRSTSLKLILANVPDRHKATDATWELVGLKLTPMPQAQFNRLGTRYRGGLTVTAVRPDSPAARQGIRRGDVLVGMHRWETTNMNHVAYVLGRPEFAKLEPIKFFIVRGHETLSGQLTVAQRRDRP
ncbi:MAG TPA: trypsin-like peptidase domain-containing protein [Pirellulales bacterium]|nr:trypsin-like peptidase domain-containing protein [Pirellulales bacterium]